MENITNEELNERIAIIKRFKLLLLEQKKKFQDYLCVLEKQEGSIESENMEALAAHTNIEQSIVSSIANLQKVIVPFYKMYSTNNVKSEERVTVEAMQKDLDSLKTKVTAQNEKNKKLLRSHLTNIQTQIKSFKNPYRNVSSVYAKKMAEGSLVAIKV